MRHWCQRADEKLRNPSPANQKPGALGVSKSDNFSVGALTPLVGRPQGYPICKKSGVGMLVVTM